MPGHHARAMTRPARSATGVSGLLAVFAWASFVLNTVIIGTGGAVRLTGSGLGCSDWPLCTPGSLVPTPEQSYHALVEFGNRTVSGPLLVAALVVFWLSWRIRSHRRDLLILSSIVLGGVLLQAFVGGFIVWFHLNANLVGFHYVASLLLVAVTAAYLERMQAPPGPRERIVPQQFAHLVHVAAGVMVVAIGFGVLTTGSGPHSGDANVIRDGFDATILSHIHAAPGYLLVALLTVLAVWAARQRLRPLRWIVTILAITGVQVLVGLYQARNGLPPLAVGVHMLLAALNAAAMTVTVMQLRLTTTPDRVEDMHV